MSESDTCFVQCRLGINFKIPWFRENVISLGIGDASRGSITRALTKQGKGSCVALVTGGAKESMFASPYVGETEPSYWPRRNAAFSLAETRNAALLLRGR